jgi:superfamily II DNA or RNA helicase
MSNDSSTGPLTAETISRYFTETPANIVSNDMLREPQLAGYNAIRAALLAGDQRVVAQIPVGCGKSGLISLLPYGVAAGRVLVIAPNLTIKRQLASDLDGTTPRSFYRQRNVLPPGSAGPAVAELDSSANHHDCDAAHIVVTNIQQLAEGGAWLDAFPSDYFDLIIVDEGHHNAAPTWQRVFDRFPGARVVSLTATPFRADGQEVEGKTVYRYTFREAMTKGYIKDIRSENVAPAELYFTYQGEERRHTLEEVLELREEAWFSKGVALAEECNVSIVDASLQWLWDLRTTGLHHQVIAVACSIDHARQVRALYQERGCEAAVIHSQMPNDERDDVLRRLRNNDLDVIVQVSMLGEGFDHKQLSVAAVFRPFRSLSPYIQFVGRVMRVNVEGAPAHQDNRGIIVSHLGLNIETLWADFKSLDSGDQELVRKWVADEGSGPGGDGTPPPRWAAGVMDVQREVLVDRFISDSFLGHDADTDALIDNAIETMREQGIDLELLGLSRDDFRRRFAAAQPQSGPTEPQRLPVQPQARRKAQRQRLNERVRSEASRVCSAVGEPATGRRIALAGGTGAANNLGAVTVRLNRKVNDLLGIDSKQRGDLSLEQLEQALSQLTVLADEVAEELTKELD